MTSATQQSGTAETVRLTVAQAVVRFLANQWSERDGERQHRLTPALLRTCGDRPHLVEVLDHGERVVEVVEQAPPLVVLA